MEMYPRLIPTFETEAGDVVQFRRIYDVPGCTHRVIINRRAVDYLGFGKPSAKSAKFFLDKHGTGRLSEMLLGSQG